MLMAKKEFDEIHKKIDRILELTNNTDVRLSVVETKLNFTASSIEEQKKNMSSFMEETVCQRRECSNKFKEIDATINKGQGAVWMVGFTGVVIGVVASIGAFLSGFFK